jgi:transposase-like protein
MWFKYRGEDRVLLICFDTATLDVVNYFIARKEDYYTWGRLLEIVDSSEADLLERAKGFYSDGKLGLVKQLRKKYSYVPLQLCVFHKYARSGQIVPFVRAKGEDERIKSMVEEVLFASSRENAVAALDDLRRYAREHQQTKKVKQIVGVLNRNFQLLLTHFDHPEMSPYNNALEGFNHILKRRIRLMKGFKKDLNLDRWIKFMLLDYRFHKINSSKFPDRNQKSPLELAGCDLPKYHNWITLVRKKAGK